MISLPPPAKALVDTTVLTDALLKQTAEGQAARAALSAIRETQLPQFAIKEFKAGPLRAYVWLHNRVAIAASWGEAIQAIQGVFRQRNLQQTALQALGDFESSLSRRLTRELAEQYKNVGDAQRAEAIIWLKTLIFNAWRKRRKITTRVIAPLSCYREVELTVKSNGTIENSPTRCGVDDCCLREQFIKAPRTVRALFEACDNLPPKMETQRRRQALRHLHRTPQRLLGEAQCISLGDAVFAFQCPNDAVILTTNTADHVPLATALGLKAIKPDAAI